MASDTAAADANAKKRTAEPLPDDIPADWVAFHLLLLTNVFIICVGHNEQKVPIQIFRLR